MDNEPSSRATAWLWVLCALVSLMCALSLWKAVSSGGEVDDAAPISWCIGVVVFGVLAVISKPAHPSELSDSEPRRSG